MTVLERAEQVEQGVKRAISRRGAQAPLLDELEREIDALRPWYQPVDLGQGLVTPATDKGGNRYWPRRSLDRGLGKWHRFIAPALPIDLQGARVLEVGCNAGLHLVECLRRGAREAIGIELDEHYQRQARFVAGALSRLRGSYVPLRVYRGAMEEVDWSLLGRFDLALALQVIYHVGRVRGERELTPGETLAAQARTLRGLAQAARWIVLGANPLEDEGFGKGAGSLQAILDAAGLEADRTVSHRHPRGHVVVVCSPAYAEEHVDVPLAAMVSKYFLAPAQSAERELADRLRAGDGAEGSRYERLRTAQEDWTVSGQAALPEGLDVAPSYWVVPWAVKPRSVTEADRAEKRGVQVGEIEHFRSLMDSLERGGFDPGRGRVRAYRLVHPERGERYQYVDGNRRVGILAALDPTAAVPVTVEQTIERGRLLDMPLARQLVEDGAMTQADALRWFDQAFAAR